MNPWKDEWAHDGLRHAWGVACPACGETVKVMVDSVEETVGATFDCSHCRALLLHSEEAGVVEMHGYLHSLDSRWPADGAGAGYVETRERMTDLGVGR